MTFLQEITRRNPGLMELSSCCKCGPRRAFGEARTRSCPADSQFAIYIAHHYAASSPMRPTWSSPFVLAMIKGDARKFAEQSVAEHPAPTEAEIAEADAAVGKYVPKQQFFAEKTPASLPAMVLAVVAADLCWPAGPGCGIAVPRRAGIAHCRGDVCEEGWPARLAVAPVLAGVGGVGPGGAGVRFVHCGEWPSI